MSYRIRRCLSDPAFSRFGAVSACDGQTDGRTRDDNKYRASTASQGGFHVSVRKVSNTREVTFKSTDYDDRLPLKLRPAVGRPTLLYKILWEHGAAKSVEPVLPNIQSEVLNTAKFGPAGYAEIMKLAARTVCTGNLGRERRSVDVFVLEANVDVVLSGRYRYIDVRHNSVFFLLLDDVCLARAINLHINVLCTHRTHVRILG